MIDEQLAERAAGVFTRVTSGKWAHPRTEIQDGGTFVLLTVDVPPSNVNDVDAEVRRSVAKALNQFVPSHPEQTLGSWMVVFRRDGNVYESLLPSGL